MSTKKMGPEERRREMMALLRAIDGPIPGTILAKQLCTSRQIIVQDVAVLRASGEEILATPRGYTMQKPRTESHQTEIVTKHGVNQCEDELMALVDLGIQILDVVVEHPIYGEIRRPLLIRSPNDVRIFMRKVRGNGASLLCELTGGVHRHTLEAPRLDLLDQAVETMRRRGYLVEERRGNDGSIDEVSPIR